MRATVRVLAALQPDKWCTQTQVYRASGMAYHQCIDTRGARLCRAREGATADPWPAGVLVPPGASLGLDLNPTYHQLAKRRTAQRGLRFAEGA